MWEVRWPVLNQLCRARAMLVRERSNCKRGGKRGENLQVLLQRQTTIHPRIRIDIRLIVRRAVTSRIPDSELLVMIQHAVEESVCVEEHDVGVGMVSLHCLRVFLEGGVPPFDHRCIWQRTAASDEVSGCAV